MSDNSISITREIHAVRIPNGEPVVLPLGTSLTITQALGGSYTVHVPGQPGLYRINAEYADALGKEQILHSPSPTSGGAVTEETIWDVLKTCYDPEIPVNIVDLGLIYSLELKPVENNAGTSVHARMTLTAPGCGMGPVIAAEAQNKISQIPGVVSADVQVVWDPPWTPNLISEEGKRKLGMA